MCSSDLPLIDEYRNIFGIMQAAPSHAQKSDTPFKDVVDLGNAIARVKGLDAAHAEIAGRISLAIFFAETGGNQNIGNARSNTYKGSFQTGVAEDKNGQQKWAAIKHAVAAVDPAVAARDDKEEARAGNLDHGEDVVRQWLVGPGEMRRRGALAHRHERADGGIVATCARHADGLGLVDGGDHVLLRHARLQIGRAHV